jgi:hypothetical protein
VPSRPRIGSPTHAAFAERVQSVLDSKKLSLYQVSQQSAKLYGRSSPCFLPHNLYYDLRAGSFTPSIHQISALSRISGYRVADWLRVFGFDLEDITRLQVLLPSKRTIVLDTSLTDPNEWVPWFDNRSDTVSIPSIAPLAKLLKGAPARRISSVEYPGVRRFVYAKVGAEDSLAFPDLLPGSIVRVNREIADVNRGDNSPLPERIFLIEHSKGFCCSRIRILTNGAVVPFDLERRYAQVELHGPQQVKLWGTVDFEFRALLRAERPEVPTDLARRWNPQPLASEENFGQMLEGTRRRRNLSIREAARMSRTIAELLRNDRYMSSPSSLSDYEVRNVAPRDFHKIVTLCCVYGLQFESVMRRIGVDTTTAGTESMPDRCLSRVEPAVGAKSGATAASRTGFLEKLMGEFQEIPVFLRQSLGYFSNSGHVSLDDFFWVGGDDDPIRPYVAKGLVVMVNRRRKTPFRFMSKPLWQLPIFLVVKRDGTYVAACGVENGALVLHPYARDFYREQEYQLHRDAEVVGQIVAIARRLP